MLIVLQIYDCMNVIAFALKPSLNVRGEQGKFNFRH